MFDDIEIGLDGLKVVDDTDGENKDEHREELEDTNIDSTQQSIDSESGPDELDVGDDIIDSSETELGNTEDEESEQVLYVVTDRPVHGLVNYFRECGLNVSNIYDNIVDVRNTVLIESEPCRIVIMDTGLGRFTTTQTRKELIDLIGICDDNTKVTVFYTDSALKVDSKRELGRGNVGIDWFEYNGTVNVVAQVLQYEERYKLNGKPDELDKQENVLDTKGLSVAVQLEEPPFDIENQTKEILEGMLGSEEGLLPKYEVNI